MSNYSNDVAKLQELEQQGNFAAANLAGIRQVFAAFPAITPHEANIKVLEAFCAPGPVNLAEVSWGLQPGNSTLIDELSIRTESEARLSFAKQIAGYSRAADREFIIKTLLENFKVGRAYEDSAIAQTPKFTTNALQSKADEAKRRAEMSKKSVADLQDIVRKGHQTSVQYPPLPAEYTAVYFKKAAPSETRKSIRVYGHEQVNARLSGRG